MRCYKWQYWRQRRFDTVEFVELDKIDRIKKDVRHSGDKYHPLSTKSTELNMFKFGDKVKHDKLSTSTLSSVCTGRYTQSTNKQSYKATNIDDWKLYRITRARNRTVGIMSSTDVDIINLAQ